MGLAHLKLSLPKWTLSLTQRPLPFYALACVCAGKNTAIVDLVNVPQVPAGEYVLGFRWDCETSSQIWTSCADIAIA